MVGGASSTRAGRPFNRNAIAVIARAVSLRQLGYAVPAQLCTWIFHALVVERRATQSSGKDAASVMRLRVSWW
jgi:hypothetical protein